MGQIFYFMPFHCFFCFFFLRVHCLTSVNLVLECVWWSFSQVLVMYERLHNIVKMINKPTRSLYVSLTTILNTFMLDAFPPIHHSFLLPQSVSQLWYIQIIFQVLYSRCKTGIHPAQDTGHHACTQLHTLLHTYGQFILVSQPTIKFLGGGRILKNLEETHQDTGRTYETSYRQ